MKIRFLDLAAGATGGTVAGIVLSVGFLAMERTTGKPSELVVLGRRTAATLGSPYIYNPDHPALEEQLLSHGGHLALSAALGVLYASIRTVPGFRGAGGGALFGAACYPLLWGLLGPTLRLTPPPVVEGLPRIAGRLGLHAAFGLITALATGALAPGRRKG